MKKIALYTLVFIIITAVMSFDEIEGIINNDSTSWLNIIVKFLVFIVLILVFDKVIKPRLFKK